jgi:hypothetical protein
MLETAKERDKQARAFEAKMREFGEMIKDDSAILTQLDRTPDKDAFINLYCRLGADRGCHFSRENVLVAVQEQKTGQNWIIPRNILTMIADRF